MPEVKKRLHKTVICKRCWQKFDLPNIAVSTLYFICPDCERKGHQ